MDKYKITTLALSAKGDTYRFIDNKGGEHSIADVQGLLNEGALSKVALSLAAHRFIHECQFDVEKYNHQLSLI